MSEKVVLVYGAFDIVHYGHLQFFKQAKRLGDRLIVAIGRDKIVEQVKGVLPFHSENERKGLIEQFRIVDEVKLGDPHNKYAVLKEVNPDILALGYDQTAFVDELPNVIKEFNLKTKVVRLEAFEPERYKSSKIKVYGNGKA